MLDLLVFVIFLAVGVGISLCRDKAGKSKLKKNLNSMGYTCDVVLDIPDISNDNMPFCFITSKTEKIWFLANYRSTTAKPYSFGDIIDYKITYRTKGDSISKGKEFSGCYSEFGVTGEKILTMMELDKSNCEYISFDLMYTGKAYAEQICNQFVLFEDQNGNFADARNHDYVVPSSCIETAKEFEDALFEILSLNGRSIVKNYDK